MNYEMIKTGTVIVGSGAAGFAAADYLNRFGCKNVSLVTEGRNMGTSRNTGSDKQTYYKLTLGGDAPDSVRELAQTLFDGGSRDGDNALCEAALSARCFLRLCELGVPFPTNSYGEYAGYKTDHDPRARATSAGPLTSKYMTEALEREFDASGVKIYDGYYVSHILTGDNGVAGLIALHDDRPVIFSCANIIWATGGPADMYAASVYPECHSGAAGVALRAGVPFVNMTESQYGLASIKFRWNLSGSYQQVIPSYISTDRNGADAREFLCDYFDDEVSILNAVFMKGYQWPFDPNKTGCGGSSLIDLAVSRETTQKNRRVWLDFTRESKFFNIENLSGEARNYLQKSGALAPLPIERLRAMNQPAIALYADNGIDLCREMLEINVCAQHNNGGIEVDADWQSAINGFYAAGECCGSFGVYRPGGSALNATQTGAFRAARHIALKNGSGSVGEPPDSEIQKELCFYKMLSDSSGGDDPREVQKESRRIMSASGAFVRNLADAAIAADKIGIYLDSLENGRLDASKASLCDMLRLRFQLTAQYSYLRAIVEYIERGGISRGSYLVTEENGEARRAENDPFISKMCRTVYKNGNCSHVWRDVRPIPDADDWFESVWKDFRQRGI